MQALVPAALLLLSAAAPAQDPVAGKQVYSQCVPCHSIDGSARTGPTLKGIFGRRSGTATGFRYSRAMQRANIVWDDQTLDAYLDHPQRAVPGNTMPFAGIADAKQRADVVAYLQTLR
jgi:cytochrome c